MVGALRRGALGHGYHVVGGRLDRFQERGPRDRVGMVGDEGAVVALDHDDAGIVVRRDHPERHVGEDGTNDAGVAEGVERDLGRIAQLPLGWISLLP